MSVRRQALVLAPLAGPSAAALAIEEALAEALAIIRPVGALPVLRGPTDPRAGAVHGRGRMGAPVLREPAAVVRCESSGGNASATSSQSEVRSHAA